MTCSVEADTGVTDESKMSKSMSVCVSTACDRADAPLYYEVGLDRQLVRTRRHRSSRVDHLCMTFLFVQLTLTS